MDYKADEYYDKNILYPELGMQTIEESHEFMNAYMEPSFDKNQLQNKTSHSLEKICALNL